MKKLSLRMRLTLTTMGILTALCVLLTLLSMRNADVYLTSPILSAIAPDAAWNASEYEPLLPSYASEADSAGGTPSKFTTQAFGLTPADQVEAISITVAAKETFDLSSILYMLAIIAGGSIATYLLLGRALRPVQMLSEEIAGITEHELSRRITGYSAGDEISRLADSFNQMLARLNKAFASQKRFASDAAHELKTPLAAIRANLDVLQMDEAPGEGEYRETLDVVRNQTGRMSRLVEDLFSMSMRQDYDFNDTVDFRGMLEKIIGELEPQIQSKRLSVKLDGRGFLSRGNEVMLQRAFFNLVENAVKYNREGGSVTVFVEPDGKEGKVTVKDTGVGVPADQIVHLFEPFYRADRSRSRKVGGAGLGLAIVRDIIERHGGSVHARENPSGGMIFTVRLPLVPPSETAPGTRSLDEL